MVEKIKDIKLQKVIAAKFTPTERLYIISLIAQCLTCEEIQEQVYQAYQKNISPGLIYQYKRTPRWIPVIKKLREEYDIQVSASPMASKRVRLDRLNRAYGRAVQKGDIDNQIKSVGTATREFDMKGDTNHFNNTLVFQQYNAMSNEELNEKLNERLKQLEQFKKEE
jgi:hypothetical protein